MVATNFMVFAETDRERDDGPCSWVACVVPRPASADEANFVWAGEARPGCQSDSKGSIFQGPLSPDSRQLSINCLTMQVESNSGGICSSWIHLRSGHATGNLKIHLFYLNNPSNQWRWTKRTCLLTWTNQCCDCKEGWDLLFPCTSKLDLSFGPGEWPGLSRVPQLQDRGAIPGAEQEVGEPEEDPLKNPWRDHGPQDIPGDDQGDCECHQEAVGRSEWGVRLHSGSTGKTRSRAKKTRICEI